MKSITYMLFLLAASANASAAGKLEISAACVADGCFPGDAADWPVTISAPGSYVLTSDLTVPSPSTTAISITSDNVSLDLGGFTIEGGNLCTGTGVECNDQSLSGDGVHSLNRNIYVQNGVTRGFGFGGIVLAGHASRIERVRSEHNFRVGIRIGEGGTVEASQAHYNGYLGLEGGRARFIDVTATRNGQTGLVGGGCIIERAIVIDNPSATGIGSGFGTLIRDSVIARNGLGIWIGEGGSRLIDTQIINNTGLGIFLQPSVPPDIPSGETQYSSFSGLSLMENNGGNDNPQIGGSGGLFVQLGLNLCGRDTTCP